MVHSIDLKGTQTGDTVAPQSSVISHSGSGWGAFVLSAFVSSRVMT